MLRCDFCLADIHEGDIESNKERTHYTDPFKLDVVLQLQSGELKAVTIDFSEAWLACPRCHKDICELNQKGLAERAVRANGDNTVTLIHEMFWLHLKQKG